MNYSVRKSGFNFWVDFLKGETGIAVNISCHEDPNTLQAICTRSFDKNHAKEQAKNMIKWWVNDLKKSQS